MATAEPVESLYKAVDHLESNKFETLAVTIGRVEDPNRLDRLIRLIERSDTIIGTRGTFKTHAALALWITLGRKR